MIEKWRNRLLERIGVQAEPETVERAQRRDRWKRQTWMIGSSCIAFGAVIITSWLASVVFPSFPPTGYAGAAVACLTVVVALVVDIKLFSWGFERFDLVAPWQFREERVDE